MINKRTHLYFIHTDTRVVNSVIFEYSYQFSRTRNANKLRGVDLDVVGRPHLKKFTLIIFPKA